jgi:hypothetical protein
MTLEVPVTITWLEERSERPSIWSTPARFDHQSETWPADCESWSVVIRSADHPLGVDNPQNGYARFLVEEAPHEWLLQYGFTLFAGPRAVARVMLRRDAFLSTDKAQP